MELKRALIMSVVMHGAIIVLLSSGIDWSWQKPKSIPLETHVVFKNKRKNKDLLPRKPKNIPASSEANAVKEIPPKKLPSPDVVKKEAKQVPKTARATAKKDSNAYTNALQALSQSFQKELTKDEGIQPEAEIDEDSSYFDQIYTLVKEAFVVPPHLLGPKAEHLRAVLRIFLAANGNLNKLELEESSGDEQFDKAVIDGTKRVSNFGPVPIFLQDALRERGIVVELCPVKCKPR